VKDRVKQAAKKNHRILRFAFKNLLIVGAMIILSKHLNLDLKCLSESECLLSNNANQFIPCLAFPRWEGAYLYFDFNRGIFIRSGKVVRRGFQATTSILRQARRRSLLVTSISCILQGKEREKRNETS